MGELIFKDHDIVGGKPVDHIYKHDGRIIPGNSDILEAAGIKKNWNLDPYYAEFGTASHFLCRLDDENDIDPMSINDDVYVRLEAYRLFKKEYKFKPRRQFTEQPIHSHIYNCATTLDREGSTEKWEEVIVELKTGDPEPWWGIQLAIQDLLLPPAKAGRRVRMAIQLKANGKFEPHAFSDRSDYSVAIGAINLYHWRANYGYIKPKGG